MKHYLLKTWLMLVCLLVGVGTSWAEKITDYANIVSGKKYYIGATSSSTDYYLSVNGSSTSTSIAGTAVTDKSNATAFVFEGSGTSWTIKFDGTSNYLGLNSSRDNGKVQVVSSAATFTLSNQSSKIRLTIGSYSVQKNNSGTQFGSYANTQTDVWLEEVGDGGGSGDGDGGEDGSASFIFNTDAGLSAIGIVKPSTGQGTNLGSSNYTSGDITMTATDGGTATRVWNSGGTTSLRVYNNGGTLTFSGATITEIVFTGTVPMTANVGTFSNKTWTGEATSVTFTATGGVTISTIVVTYESDGKTTPTLSFANSTYNATMGEGFDAPELTNPQEVSVTYSSSEEGVATVNATTGAITLVARGTTTITASFAGDEEYNEASASYQLVVAAPVQKYTISYAATENGTIVVKNGDTPLAEGAEVAEGTTLTIECTPTDAENYRFKNWQYKAGEAAWATRTSDFSYTMPSANVQFKANFEEIPTYTVAFSVNGAIVQSENLKEGAAVTAYADPVEINGKVFTGWIETATVEGATPAYVTPITTATKTVTYYAVFATKTGEAEITYTKLTSNSFDNSAEYVLAAEETSSSSTLHYFSSYTGTTANESWGVTSTDADDALVFTLSGTANALVAQDASGNYIQALATGKFRMSSSNTTLLLNSNGQIYNPAENSTYNLRYNHNNGSGGFRWYNTTTGTSAYFYKKEGGATYSDYCTTVVTPLHGDGTINFVATTGDGKYYATFSSTRAIKFDEAFINDAETCVASVKAYAVAVVDGQILRTDQYNVNNDGNYTYIPANTGVLFEYILEDEYTFDGAVPFEYADAEAEYLSTVEDNMLVATPTTGACPSVLGTNYYYKLAYGDNTNQTKLGFWWGAEDGSNDFNVKAGGAVLVVPQSQGSNLRGFSFGDETTGINAVETSTNDAIYNLQGQRINRVQKGVNIVNGHKVIR